MPRNAFLYQMLADAMLILHVSIVMFVVGDLLLIVVGSACKWSWVKKHVVQIIACRCNRICHCRIMTGNCAFTHGS
jgi:UDP-2,3-diacylglucosamine pyrophosphatase LpxH